MSRSWATVIIIHAVQQWRSGSQRTILSSNELPPWSFLWLAGT